MEPLRYIGYRQEDGKMAEFNKKNVFFQDANRLNAPLEIFLHSETGSKGVVGPHWHYYLEILYLLTGTLEAQCDNTFYTMHPGDLILFQKESLIPGIFYFMFFLPFCFCLLLFYMNTKEQVEKPTK